jgi:hypothetical protein
MPKKTKKWTKFLYLPDPHGFAVDPGAWKVAMQFKKDYQPDRVVIGGDFMDLRALRKGACDDDLTEQVRPDFDKGIELLNESEATDVILGNHDDRLWQVANSSGVASEFCKYLVEKLEWWARDRGIDLVPYRADSYLELGPQLKALHGNCANVHSAMKMAQVYGCCVFGTSIGYSISEPTQSTGGKRGRVDACATSSRGITKADKRLYRRSMGLHTGNTATRHSTCKSHRNEMELGA